MEKLAIGAQMLPAVSATEAKNEFGLVLEKAITLGAVAITKHEAPKAVLMSIQEYRRLVETNQLDALSAEFDALLAEMQTSTSRDAVTSMLRMSGEAPGRAASRAQPGDHVKRPKAHKAKKAKRARG